MVTLDELKEVPGLCPVLVGDLPGLHGAMDDHVESTLRRPAVDLVRARHGHPNGPPLGILHAPPTHSPHRKGERNRVVPLSHRIESTEWLPVGLDDVVLLLSDGAGGGGVSCRIFVQPDGQQGLAAASRPTAGEAVMARLSTCPVRICCYRRSEQSAQAYRSHSCSREPRPL